MNRTNCLMTGAEDWGKKFTAGLLLLCAVSAAGRVWTSAETETLLRTLTDSPRQYWIEAGHIRVKHLQYRQADDWLAQSEESIIFDGQRFRWEIILEGDEQSVPQPMRPGQKPLRVPDKAANRHRVFVWDGQRYIRYYPTMDYAVVSEQPDASMVSLRGPLTAEIIPWGYGDYALSALQSRQPTVREEDRDGKTVLRLSFVYQKITPPLECVMLLDPSKDYAVLSVTLDSPAARISTTYSDYIQVGGRWVPRAIRTERHAKTGAEPELISYEDWVFTEIQAAVPSKEALTAPFKDGTLVEVHPGPGKESLLYYTRRQAPVAELLSEKLSQSRSGSGQPDCASAAVQMLKRRFAASVLPGTAPRAASAAASEQPMTSLHEVKQRLEQAGLYCLAVQTDLETLRGLSDCGIIVHLPNQQHYLIVDRIDSQFVWTIDLSSRKFYWKWQFDDFIRDWKDGTALLVADSPNRLPTQLRTLDPMRLYEILGGDGEQYETYSCTQKIQNDDWIPCPVPVGGFICYGKIYIYYPRYGCVEDVNGGFCEGRPMDGMDSALCVNHPSLFGFCQVSEWYTTYIRACL